MRSKCECVCMCKCKLMPYPYGGETHKRSAVVRRRASFAVTYAPARACVQSVRLPTAGTRTKCSNIGVRGGVREVSFSLYLYMTAIPIYEVEHGTHIIRVCEQTCTSVCCMHTHKRNHSHQHTQPDTTYVCMLHTGAVSTCASAYFIVGCGVNCGCINHVSSPRVKAHAARAHTRSLSLSLCAAHCAVRWVVICGALHVVFDWVLAVGEPKCTLRRRLRCKR